MKARLYLHPDCLKYDSKESDVASYIDKFSTLIKDFAEVIELYKDDTEYIYSDQLYETKIFEESDICTFVEKYLEPDNQKIFYLFLSRFAQSLSFSPEDIKVKSVYDKDEDACHALIVLNQPSTDDSKYKYIQFEKYELIYNKHSVLTVKRQILGNHPGLADEFMKQAEIYFPDIIFSSHCSEVIGFYLKIIPRKIVYYLSCINDKLVDFFTNHPNKNSINEVCADFAGQYGMDRAGSLQSTPAKSAKYTFEFRIGEDLIWKCCGPHFKITHIDDNCQDSTVQKNEVFHARIYFCIDENQVYIGSIGPHV